MSNATGNRVPGTPHASFGASRHGLTLIEMLIGMAITLLMMAAVVTLFANIGSGVRIRQATIEMSAKLRSARATLYNDLTHATCRAVPWQRPDEDPGYLEIVEGRASDRKPSDLIDGDPTNGEINFAISQLPGSQNTPSGQTTDGGGLGDYDDIIAMTVRQENAPFRGAVSEWDPVLESWVSSNIETSTAEVIWFAVENPATSREEPGMRNVYRRVLLIAPWLPSREVRNDPQTLNQRVYLRMLPPYTTQPIDYIDANGNSRTTMVTPIVNDDDVFQISDVSFHREGNLRVANSLGDLTKRENRFAHFYDPNSTLMPARGFPHRFPFDSRDPNDSIAAGVEFSSLQPLSGIRLGDDQALENVLAFDVLVYDPGAPLFEYPIGSGNIIEPYPESPPTDTLHTTAVNNGQLVGFGAYVDLGWDDGYDYRHTNYLDTSGQPLAVPHFREARRAGWHPFSPNIDRGTPVYDTWSLHYEYDGINQADHLGQVLIDEGTNGLDDNGVNGVDEAGSSSYDTAGLLIHAPGERETSPPYDVPLRGVRVKMRIYEPDTRQTREVSVTASFVPQ